MLGGYRVNEEHFSEKRFKYNRKQHEKENNDNADICYCGKHRRLRKKS